MSRSSYLVHKPVTMKNVNKRVGLTEEILHRFYLIQPKYDGVSLIVKLLAIWDEATQTCAFEITTRTGEVVTTCDHIGECLAKFPGIVPGVYFGEGWIPGQTQAYINGLVTRHAASPDVQMPIFDYVTLDEFNQGQSTLGYEDRVARLPETFFRIETEGAPIWPAACEGTLDEIGITGDEAARQYVALGGYDGVIARHPLGTWTMGGGSNGEIVKIKPRGIYLTLRVIGYELGKGKYTGRIGTLIVSLNGKRQGAGTGLKDSQRDVANFERDWLGKLVDITALGYTEDGMLREPVLGAVRHDVLEPDA